MTHDPNDVPLDGPEPSQQELEQSTRSLHGDEGVDQDFTNTVQLISRYGRGDTAALDRLFSRYFHRVRVVVRSRLPERYRSVIDIDDVVQRTFVAAFRGIERFEHRSEGSFMRWITTIAINECNSVHDYMNAVKRGEGQNMHLDSLVLGPSSEGDSIGFDPRDSVDLPADVLAKREQADLVATAMSRLKDEYREVILLRDYMGQSWRDIGEELGRTEGAASMLHTRARVALGRILNEMGLKG